MFKMCETCTYMKDGLCTKGEKPSLCTVKTKKGIYKNRADSNIIIETPFGETLRFKSETEKGHFERLLNYRLERLNAIKGVIYRYTDATTKTFDLTNLVMLTYKKTYKEVVEDGKIQYS